jgi:tetratricopeptide (TPR) repeat protein
MQTLFRQCLMALLLSPMAFSQLRIESSFSGQLKVAGARDYTRLRAQITDLGQRDVVAEVAIGPLGSFEFSAAPTGVYMLRIMNLQGEVVHAQSVTLPYHGVMTVEFGAGENAPARMPVSLARLQHKVPKKALKAFEKSREAWRAGDMAAAQVEIEKALALDPLYFEAANDLGVIHLKANRFEQAYEMFRRAAAIDESDAQVEANLAYALLALKRFPEAEEAARTVVRVDALSGKGRYLLAVSLLEQRKSAKEVLFHLTQAKENFEPARKLLQKLEAQMAGR